MNRVLLVLTISLVVGMLLLAQSTAPIRVADPVYPRWDVRVVQPREVSPARYVQVDQAELARAASEGWELVSVAPYVIFNEERGPEGNKVGVTQTYPAYYFKRPKVR